MKIFDSKLAIPALSGYITGMTGVFVVVIPQMIKRAKSHEAKINQLEKEVDALKESK